MIDLEQARLIIERGQRAADLLANPSFQWIVDDQTQYHLAALVAAPPGPRGCDARDYHHLQQHALSELVATLTGYAQAGAEQAARLVAIGDDDDTEELP